MARGQLWEFWHAEERGFLVYWAPLGPSGGGGLLTHNGWSSTLEGIVAGVRMLCWPTIPDQQINSRWVSIRYGGSVKLIKNNYLFI